MIAPLGLIRSIRSALRNFPIRPERAAFALLVLLSLLGSNAIAQTTTVSGTVYDPRTTTSPCLCPMCWSM